MGDGSTIRIEALGHRGDGIGTVAGETVYVPFALPGETVQAPGKGTRRTAQKILSASKDRVPPFCVHFTQCGGCQLQQMALPAYLEWKTGLLSAALQREKIDAFPEPMRHYPRDSRRRAVLTATRNRGRWSLGFSGRRSHDVVDLTACPILVPVLQSALPAARHLLELMGRHGVGRRGAVRVTLLSAENGIDCAVSFDGQVPDNLWREIPLHEAAREFLRIAVKGEIACERERPVIKAGSVHVAPPPGGFMQAVAAAEEDMAALTVQHLAGCRKVADLFCGSGAFALRLAGNAVVHAAESEQAALDALDRSWRETGGKLKALTHERRDLFKRPLMAQELKGIDGVVFDPPRAGAEMQCRELAKSNVKKIVAVSCNPLTLARDLRILLDGGYQLKTITPIDQFACTPHLEAVVLLAR